MKDMEDKATHHRIFKKMLIFENLYHILLAFNILKHVLHKKFEIKLILLEKTHD